MNARGRSVFMKQVHYEMAFASVILLLTSCSRNCTSLPTQCDLTPESGPCEAVIEKYFFDSEDQVCKPFIWGGCEGTVPFDTIEECQQCECHENGG